MKSNCLYLPGLHSSLHLIIFSSSPSQITFFICELTSRTFSDNVIVVTISGKSFLYWWLCNQIICFFNVNCCLFKIYLTSGLQDRGTLTGMEFPKLDCIYLGSSLFLTFSLKINVLSQINSQIKL